MTLIKGSHKRKELKKMEKLTWEKLLSTERERPSSVFMDTNTSDNYIARNAFEADYDRIVGSSSVRRLQDKAQVFPLQEGDVARTRLTHSIEVSAMARSFGKAVGQALEKREGTNFTSEKTEELAALLQVAGLIHDLGNPPFGHYGETIIRQWFKKYLKNHPHLLESEMDDQEKRDFLYFDGNVQNLRIVTKLQTQNDTYGANFTYATLATIMKYPWPSSAGAATKGKFGYFKSEQDLAFKIRSTLGLGDMVRHPATYLLEAADDIIYLCDDIEDGVKKGYVNWDSEYQKLKSKLDHSSEKLHEIFEKIDKKYVDERMEVHEQTIARARNFRNIVQTFLFSRCVETFLNHYDNIIMANIYTEETKGFELLKCEEPLVKELKRITRDNCFACHEVLALELEGDRVISTLLDIFTDALLSNPVEDLVKTNRYCGKIFALISPNFVYRTLHDHASRNEIIKEVQAMQKEPEQYKIRRLRKLSRYELLHLITDFISGMSDSYAVKLYQELCGIRRP